jgi:hypothetical protein
MSQTHYQTLGVSETATQAEIKNAYRRLARKYHPDRNKKKGAEEKFKEINSAYQILGDPSRRQIYNYDLLQRRKTGTASGSSSAGAGAPPPPHSSGFSNGAGAHAAPQPPPPSAPPSHSRYLFFVRGVFVGGAAVAATFVLLLIMYVACRRTPAAVSREPREQLAPPLEHRRQNAPVSPRVIAPTATPAVPTPDPTPSTTPTDIPEPTRTPVPIAVSNAPVPRRTTSTRDESWRLRPTPVHHATVGSGCIDGWWDLPGGRRVRCIDHSHRSSR